MWEKTKRRRGAASTNMSSPVLVSSVACSVNIMPIYVRIIVMYLYFMKKKAFQLRDQAQTFNRQKKKLESHLPSNAITPTDERTFISMEALSSMDHRIPLSIIHGHDGSVRLYMGQSIFSRQQTAEIRTPRLEKRTNNAAVCRHPDTVKDLPHHSVQIACSGGRWQ